MCQRLARHREPVRSTGRHPHGRRLAIQPAFMLNSSPAQKVPHTLRARQASDCHLPHGKAPEAPQDTGSCPSEKALVLARCVQGSERTVCSNAFIGAVCRAVRCGAVQCTQHVWRSPAQDLQSGVHAGFFRARGCRASGQGSRRVAEAAVAAWRSALGAYLARCRG